MGQPAVWFVHIVFDKCLKGRGGEGRRGEGEGRGG